jgi:hypothetical protein
VALAEPERTWKVDKEFHYDVIYFLAAHSGFSPDEAQTIAYSSQFTDDNQRQYDIEGYKNYVSQTLNILKPKDELIRIYPAFHFMPGPKPEMHLKDGRLHMLQVEPGNDNAMAMLKTAFELGDLYRVGVAVHVLADTFAHQGFTGTRNTFNSMQSLKGVLTPSIGHADAGFAPDRVSSAWSDTRRRNLVIHNNDRFIDAVVLLAEFFSEHGGKKPDLRKLLDIWAISDRERRKAAYKALIRGYVDYYPEKWLMGAVTIDGIWPFRKYMQTVGFWESNWYRFQEAVKGHQREALALLTMLDNIEIPHY